MVCVFCHNLIEFPGDVEVCLPYERRVCHICFRQTVDAEPVMTPAELDTLLRRLGIR